MILCLASCCKLLPRNNYTAATVLTTDLVPCISSLLRARNHAGPDLHHIKGRRPHIRGTDGDLSRRCACQSRGERKGQEHQRNSRVGLAVCTSLDRIYALQMPRTGMPADLLPPAQKTWAREESQGVNPTTSASITLAVLLLHSLPDHLPTELRRWIGADRQSLRNIVTVPPTECEVPRGCLCKFCARPF
jgi:hypothetical protein